MNKHAFLVFMRIISSLIIPKSRTLDQKLNTDLECDPGNKCVELLSCRIGEPTNPAKKRPALLAQDGKRENGG